MEIGKAISLQVRTGQGGAIAEECVPNIRVRPMAGKPDKGGGGSIVSSGVEDPEDSRQRARRGGGPDRASVHGFDDLQAIDTVRGPRQGMRQGLK